MSDTVKTTSIPRTGMFATVRNRRGIVAAVEPFDGDTGRLHLVHLEYKDDQYPIEEQLLWELEPHKNLLEPTALPLTSSTDPMPREDFDALLRASRWTAAMPYLDPDGDGPLDRKPITSPFHGAVRVEMLGKRLSSCSTAFAESWRRCKEGLAEGEAAADTEVASSRKRSSTTKRRRRAL